MSSLRPRRHFAQRELLKAKHIPAPVGGMNLVDPASALSELDALSTVNLVKGERGLLPRPGWREWATNVGATAGEVRSVMPFHGTTTVVNRLFACAPNGIYDVTASGAAPTLKHTFAVSDGNSGRGVYCAVTTAAGPFLLYADETNGYLLYTGGTDIWAAGSTTGLAPADAAFVALHKNRVWFAQRNTLKAWYLAAGPTISGAATVFDLSAVFSKGGSLAGIWAWSLDSGTGRDDLLVFVTTAGELALYGGSDVAAADWALRGRWDIGGVPAGRRLAFSYGNDLLLLTTQGILPISTLTREGAQQDQLYTTRPLQPLFVQTMSEQASRIGWEMNINPKAGFMFVNTPGLPGSLQEQYAMSYSSRGWSRLQGLDILSTAVWDGNLYFGTRDGRVCQSNGYVDNVKLGGDTSQAKSINCFTIGGFSTLGSLSYKIIELITPRFITHGVTPAQTALARFDFDVSDAGAAGGVATGLGSVWDTAIWDTALWGGSLATAEVVQGATGRGVHVAVGVAFQSQDYSLLVGFDVAWQEEGLL